MEPTEHAHHIAPTVHHLLDSIAKDLLTKSAFQPENYAGVCRIGLTDYAEFILLLGFMTKYASAHQRPRSVLLTSIVATTWH